MLTEEDRKDIGSIVTDNVMQLMEHVIMPQFMSLEKSVGELKTEVVSLGVDVKLLGEITDNLENNMVGVKMRLTSIEKKLDDKLDISSEIKGREKRITRLEKVLG